MNSAASEPKLISLDWGTSSLRAFLIGANGEVLSRAASSEGIMNVPDGNFESVFETLLRPWLAIGDIPVLASGMITSRNGWIETPYAQLPLGAETLAREIVAHKTSKGVVVHFITGATHTRNGKPDVMRGEETQIVGAATAGITSGTFVMPGTHSKWVRVSNGKIDSFSTQMTGEVYAALKDHTILGALIEGKEFDATVFEKGVSAGLQDSGNLLHQLFHVRTLPLMGVIPKTSTADYLSGLLIGTEISAATQHLNTQDTVAIIGRNDLTERYEIGLKSAGLRFSRAPNDIVAKGHFAIAQAAGLLK